MAGIDARNVLPAAVTPQTGGAASNRLQAVKEAQRAFFNAALAGEAPAAAPPPTGAKAQAPGASSAAPDARLRPGSIVDIKV